MNNRDARTNPKRRSGTLFDAATITVLLLAGGLWLCWPRPSTQAAVNVNVRESITYSEVPGSSLRLVREPLLFLRHERNLVLTLDDDDADIYARFSTTGHRTPVELPSAQGPSSILDLNSIQKLSVRSLAHPYQTPLSAKSTFSNAPENSRFIDVDASASLVAIGFRSDIAQKRFEGFGDASWFATLEISGATGNRPEDVFVIESSGNTALDLRLVRELYNSEVNEQSRTWRGRVVISRRPELRMEGDGL